MAFVACTVYVNYLDSGTYTYTVNYTSGGVAKTGVNLSPISADQGSTITFTPANGGLTGNTFTFQLTTRCNYMQIRSISASCGGGTNFSIRATVAGSDNATCPASNSCLNGTCGWAWVWWVVGIILVALLILAIIAVGKRSRV